MRARRGARVILCWEAVGVDGTTGLVDRKGGQHQRGGNFLSKYNRSKGSRKIFER